MISPETLDRLPKAMQNRFHSLSIVAQVRLVDTCNLDDWQSLARESGFEICANCRKIVPLLEMGSHICTLSQDK